MMRRSNPNWHSRRVMALIVALALVPFLGGCGSEDAAAPAGPPTTGASQRSPLMGQWRYQSVLTPTDKKVRLRSANAWLVLRADGSAQGSAMATWSGSFEADKGWIKLKATNLAAVPRTRGTSRAERLAVKVTEKLLAGDRVSVAGPKKRQLRLRVHGYVLTLVPWR